MTLKVDWDAFIGAIKRHVKEPHAYATRRDGRTRVTAADQASRLIVTSETRLSVDDVKRNLLEHSISLSEGEWIEAALPAGDAPTEIHVAAVAYKSGDDMPGIWVDAYSEAPTLAVVLKAIYDEFRETGEVGDLAFEEFIRLASPNVVIVSPVELANYIEQKIERDCE